MAFSHLEEAADSMESIDVFDCEYQGAFTLDGFMVDIAGVREGPVSLPVTGRRTRRACMNSCCEGKRGWASPAMRTTWSQSRTSSCGSSGNAS
jgi:hypothetical protein